MLARKLRAVFAHFVSLECSLMKLSYNIFIFTDFKTDRIVQTKSILLTNLLTNCSTDPAPQCTMNSDLLKAHPSKCFQNKMINILYIRQKCFEKKNDKHSIYKVKIF